MKKTACTYHNLATVWVVDIGQACSRTVKPQLSDVRVGSMVCELNVKNDLMLDSSRQIEGERSQW